MVKDIIFTPPPNGDENQGPAYIGAAWALVSLSTISTAIRILVRGRLTRNMGADDYLMLTTVLCNLVGLGFVTKEYGDGFGRHMYYIQPAHKRNFTVVGWLDWMQTFITIMLCKISICLFLLRIKNTRRNWWYMHGLIAANVVVTIVAVGLFIGICSPPDAYWIVGKDGKCLSNERVMAIIIAQGSTSHPPIPPLFFPLSPRKMLTNPPTVFSALTDILLATTPLLFLSHLQISPRTKLALCILMGAGYITAAAAITRTALSGAILETDVTYALVPNAAWRATEVNLGIICANAPIWRPLYLWWRGRLQRKGSGKGGSTGYVANKAGRQGRSEVRLWPGRWGRGSEEEGKGVQGESERTGYTDASAELGLPIEGYLMGDRRSGRSWLEEEGKQERGRGRLGWEPPVVMAKGVVRG